MQTPSTESLEQGKRVKVVYFAIGVFFLFFCLFLILLDQDIQKSTSSISSIQQNVPQADNAFASTPSPFWPNTSTPQVIDEILFTETTTSTPSKPIITNTVTPSPTATQLKIIEPQAQGTVYPVYIVNSGDRLESIAQVSNIPLETLRNANFMYGDAILPGQALIIPLSDSVSEPVWRFASLDKDQGDIFYPLFIDVPEFRMHYMPNTYPSVDPLAVAGMMGRGLKFVENSFGKPLDFRFDIYVTGTLFERPNSYLLGRSFSQDREVFFLHNGGGDATHQQYLAAHELTHLYAWNTFGPPVSFLVSEGAAVYTGMKMIADSQYMPINTFCAVYKVEGQLPLLYTKTELKDFRGHNNNLVNYYSTGCFVGYLIETYGTEKFGELYYTQDYDGIYGKTLEQLEIEWKDSIVIDGIAERIDTHRFVNAVDIFMATNDAFFYSFNGSEESILAYQALDDVRLALLSGNLDDFDKFMSVFQAANVATGY